MKKVLVFICLIFSLLFLSSCMDKTDYSDFVKEERSEIYEGISENYSLLATYGFEKTDGKKIYSLKFRIKEGANSLSSYRITLSHGGTELENDFSFNPVTNGFSTRFYIENFSEKTFSVFIVTVDKKEKITLSSVLQEGTISPEYALNCLFNSQKTLMNSYFSEDGFSGEITQKVTVKNGRSYWYFMIEKGENRKALLLDGKTAEVLAIRDVF